MARTGIKKTLIVANRLYYDRKVVKNIVNNWIRNNRYNPVSGVFYIDFKEGDHLHNVVELTLFSMLGAGEIECVQVKEEEPTEPLPDISETLKEIEENKRKRDSGPYQFMKAV